MGDGPGRGTQCGRDWVEKVCVCVCGGGGGYWVGAGYGKAGWETPVGEGLLESAGLSACMFCLLLCEHVYCRMVTLTADIPVWPG